MIYRFDWLQPLQPGLLAGAAAGAATLRFQPTRGAGDGEPPKPDAPLPPEPERPSAPPRPHGSNQGPPDLDELWRDFNRRLGRLFGQRGGGGGRRNSGGSGGGFGGFHPDGRSARIGIVVAVVGALAIWLASGFFLVHEGDRAVVTTFGKYAGTRMPGLNWRFPYPIQSQETVRFSQIRSVDVGGDSIIKSTGLRESGMLTEDENIVEVKFAVQYRLNNARDFLFNTKDPDQAVVLVAESAVREVVGNMSMNVALAEERDQIAPRVRTQMQNVLDRYGVGIDVVAVNMQQGGVRPPEQVQDAFDDVLKAGQEAERIRNEAQAYANGVVPRARGTAARLTQEADGYKARIVAQAQGDSERFLSILPEYQKAPKVTRDRMYIDAMEAIYSGVDKIIVDSSAGGNLLYLPLDQLMQGAGGGAAARKSGTAALPPPADSTVPPSASPAPASTGGGSARNPDAARARTSDFR